MAFLINKLGLIDLSEFLSSCHLWVYPLNCGLYMSLSTCQWVSSSINSFISSLPGHYKICIISFRRYYCNYRVDTIICNNSLDLNKFLIPVNLVRICSNWYENIGNFLENMKQWKKPEICRIGRLLHQTPYIYKA